MGYGSAFGIHNAHALQAIRYRLLFYRQRAYTRIYLHIHDACGLND